MAARCVAPGLDVPDQSLTSGSTGYRAGEKDRPTRRSTVLPGEEPGENASGSCGAGEAVAAFQSDSSRIMPAEDAGCALWMAHCREPVSPDGNWHELREISKDLASSTRYMHVSQKCRAYRGMRT